MPCFNYISFITQICFKTHMHCDFTLNPVSKGNMLCILVLGVSRDVILYVCVCDYRQKLCGMPFMISSNYICPSQQQSNVIKLMDHNNLAYLLLSPLAKLTEKNHNFNFSLTHSIMRNFFNQFPPPTAQNFFFGSWNNITHSVSGTGIIGAGSWTRPLWSKKWLFSGSSWTGVS